MTNYCEETEQCRRQFFYEKFTENQLKFFEKCGKMCDHCRRLKGLDLNEKYWNKPNTNNGNNDQKTGNRYGALTTTTAAVFDITGNDNENDGWIQRRAPTLPSSLSNENKPKAGFVSARSLHQSSASTAASSLSATTANNNLLEKKRQIPGSLPTTSTLGKPIRQTTIPMLSSRNNNNSGIFIQSKVEKEENSGGGGKFSTALGKTVLSHFMSNNPINNNNSNNSTSNNSGHDGFKQKNSYNNAIELDQEEDDWILPASKKVKREYSL
jgi:superfamily II DNA helicase RecQ